MKKVILFFALIVIGGAARAQSGYNYYEWGFGLAGSYGKAEADLRKQDYHPAFSASLIYNFSPYMPIALEVQKGIFSGGSRNPKLDPYGRVFRNSYFSVNLHGDIQLGEIIDYGDSFILNAMKNGYLGTGIGIINNKMTDIQRFNQIPANDVLGSTVGFEGADKGINLIIPIRIGYEFKIFDYYGQPRYGIDLGIQHYFDIGEGIDGYNDSSQKFKNNAMDQYTFVTIGFKYNFGNTTSYTKLIPRSRY